MNKGQTGSRMWSFGKGKKAGPPGAADKTKKEAARKHSSTPFGARPSAKPGSGNGKPVDAINVVPEKQPNAETSTQCSSCGKEMSRINNDVFFGISAKAAIFINMGVPAEILKKGLGYIEPEKMYTFCYECWYKYAEPWPQ